MMNESSGPKNARRCGECHVFASMACKRLGIEEPQRILFVPVESLKLRSHESGVGPNVAQWSSATVLPRSKSCSVDGRLRLWW
jgi:hypothetical protein